MCRLKNISSLLFICLFLSGVALKAQESISYYEELFRTGNEQYSQGNYEKANAIYDEIISAGYISPVLYYNQGNACFKMNKFGASILWYERAKRIMPEDSDISFNLDLANGRIKDKIEPLPELFYQTWWKNTLYSISVDAWGKVALINFFIAFILLALFIMARPLFIKKLFFTLGCLLIGFTFFSYLCAYQQKSNIMAKDSAIVLAPSVTVKSKPDESGTTLFVIHEGTKIRLHQQVDQWLEISLPDGNVGWLSENTVEVI